MDRITESPRRIVLLESTNHDAKVITSCLREQFPQADIVHFETESKFREGMDSLRINPPDIAVLELLVRWANPGPDWVEHSEEFLSGGGIYLAGLRCRQSLLDDPATAEVPAIIYSVIDPETKIKDPTRSVSLPPLTSFLQKRGSVEPLAALIRSVITSRAA